MSRVKLEKPHLWISKSRHTLQQMRSVSRYSLCPR